ncbi:hypothetical protein CH373_13550 [Leptospira perolatii]|uniref:Uncharacterized protein n=1 Tax=Leptospira perolatii TaxID=2023191 RepID=A0A2M9ZKX1_9LEPT|nr:hypothetical protein CH360_08135 [Leptospira perolatii]PJZ72722.1 hypothetical protein CH373_13550 [Leptospira perolatii]
MDGDFRDVQRILRFLKDFLQNFRFKPEMFWIGQIYSAVFVIRLDSFSEPPLAFRILLCACLKIKSVFSKFALA